MQIKSLSTCLLLFVLCFSLFVSLAFAEGDGTDGGTDGTSGGSNGGTDGTSGGSNGGTDGSSVLPSGDSTDSTPQSPSTPFPGDTNTGSGSPDPTPVTPLAPTDACPNIAGAQETIPAGMALDGAGNCADINDAPVFTFSAGPFAINEGQTLTFAVSASDPDGTPVTITAAGLPPGATFSGNVFTWTPGFTQAGVYTVTFTATDGVNVVTQTVTITVANVNAAPVFSGFASAYTVNEGQLLTFIVTATDPDGLPVTVTAAGMPAGAAFAGNTFTWTPSFTQNGVYTITLTASDGTLTTVTTVTITVIDVNAAPVFSGFAPAFTVNEGQNLAFTVTATDPDGMPVTLSVAGLPTGAAFNPTTGAFTWTPGFTQNGVYTITIIATDGTFTINQIVTITVIDVNGPPQFSGFKAAYTINEGQFLAFTVTATDPEGLPVTLTVSGLPFGATMAGTTFNWQPNYAQSGVYTVTLSANDGAVTSVQIVTITVLDFNNVNNQAPILDRIGDKFVFIGKRLMFLVTGSDPDGDTLFFGTFNNLPSGASFIGNTFDWIPGKDQEGTYKVRFGVTDGDLFDSELVEIRVEDERFDLTLHSVAFPDGDFVGAGEQLTALISMQNDGNVDIDDVRIRAYFMDEGLTVLSEEFDLDAAEQTSKRLNFDIPADLEPGLYSVGFSVRSDDTSRRVYREIEVI